MDFTFIKSVPELSVRDIVLSIPAVHRLKLICYRLYGKRDVCLESRYMGMMLIWAESDRIVIKESLTCHADKVCLIHIRITDILEMVILRV